MTARCSIRPKRLLFGGTAGRPSIRGGDQGLEPSFEAGTVHILRGPWLDEWKKQFGEFPDEAH